MTSAIAALRFLTVLPVPGPDTTMRDVARGQAWFPAVGLLIGGGLLGLDRLASRALPLAAVDVLLVVALAAVTGALHLDGLADAADGLFGGRTASERLTIMRDRTSGSFAIVAVVSVLAMKWAGLLSLPGDARYEAILLAPCLARFAMLVSVAGFPYAREQGLGAEFTDHGLAGVSAGGAITLAACVALMGAGGVALFGFSALAGTAIGAWVTRLAGGMTGDAYGAVVEITEACALLFIASLANRGWIDAFALG